MLYLKTFRGLLVLAAGLALTGCAAGSGYDFGNLSSSNRIGGPSHYGAYLAAQQAQYDGDTVTAARQFRRALQIGPADPEILERAYVLDISNGDVAEAARLAEVALEVTPENTFARLTVAVDWFKRGHYAESRELMEGVDAGVLTNLTVALLQAWSYAGENQPDTGMADLAGQQLDGVELFQSYHGALLADLAGDLNNAEVGYVAAITGSGGSSARVVEAYGNFLERTGRSAEAVRIYDAYLDIVPHNASVAAARERANAGRAPRRLVNNARAGAAEALFSVASVVAGQGAYDVPALYLQLALHLNPDLDEARSLLGDLYAQMELFDQAEQVYAAINPRSPLRFSADIQRAFLFNRMDREDDAIRLLARLTNSDPHSFQAWIAYADTLRGESEFEDAANAYAQAIGLLDEEQQSDPRYWSLYYSYGISLERIGEWPAAENAFQYALTLNEDQPYVLNYLGYSWIERGENLDEALAMIHRAVEQEPNDGFIIDSLGWGYYQLGQYDEAVLYLERAVELASGDPTLNDHLGDAYWRVGRTREARFQWSHALGMNPDEDQVPVIEAKLADGLSDQPATADNHGGN